jgi:hypothetical protein
MPAFGTKRKYLDSYGISGTKGRPAVPSAWRRQLPVTPQPTFTKTKSRGSSWVERRSASMFFFDDGYAPFPTIHKTDVGGPRQIAVIRRSYPVTREEPQRSTKFSLTTSHEPWRRRRPAALPVQCRSDGHKEGLDGLLVVDDCECARPVRATSSDRSPTLEHAALRLSPGSRQRARAPA